MWSDATHFVLHLLANGERFDEVMNRLLSNMLIRASQGLECLVGLRIPFPTKNGLKCLSDHSPVTI